MDRSKLIIIGLAVGGLAIGGLALGALLAPTETKLACFKVSMENWDRDPICGVERGWCGVLRQAAVYRLVSSLDGLTAKLPRGRQEKASISNDEICFDGELPPRLTTVLQTGDPVLQSVKEIICENLTRKDELWKKCQ